MNGNRQGEKDDFMQYEEKKKLEIHSNGKKKVASVTMKKKNPFLMRFTYKQFIFIDTLFPCVELEYP